jgi:predicted metalloprotease with PDZ domain
MAGRELTRETIDWSYGLGIKTNADGALLEVVQASPAFAAGLVPGGKLVAVDDAKFSPEALRRGMERAVAGGSPLVLLVERRGEVRTAEVTLVRGAVYPHLEPLAATPDALARILQPRAQP